MAGFRFDRQPGFPKASACNWLITVIQMVPTSFLLTSLVTAATPLSFEGKVLIAEERPPLRHPVWYGVIECAERWYGPIFWLSDDVVVERHVAAVRIVVPMVPHIAGPIP